LAACVLSAQRPAEAADQLAGLSPVALAGAADAPNMVANFIERDVPVSFVPARMPATSVASQAREAIDA
jgi:hypothetical protein